MLIITFSSIISAAICIYGKYLHNRALLYVFKPLTTILIGLIALLNSIHKADEFKYFVYVAFVFAMVGDILLLQPAKFKEGLISFLVMHLILLTGLLLFSSEVHIILLSGFIAFGITVYLYLYSSLGNYKVAVLIYMVIFLAMSWRAWEVYFDVNTIASLVFALGTLVFIISDITLSVNRFKRSFFLAEFIILTTYYSALWMIAVST